MAKNSTIAIDTVATCNVNQRKSARLGDLESLVTVERADAYLQTSRPMTTADDETGNKPTCSDFTAKAPDADSRSESSSAASSSLEQSPRPPCDDDDSMSSSSCSAQAMSEEEHGEGSSSSQTSTSDASVTDNTSSDSETAVDDDDAAATTVADEDDLTESGHPHATDAEDSTRPAAGADEEAEGVTGTVPLLATRTVTAPQMGGNSDHQLPASLRSDFQGFITCSNNYHAHGAQTQSSQYAQPNYLPMRALPLVTIATPRMTYVSDVAAPTFTRSTMLHSAHSSSLSDSARDSSALPSFGHHTQHSPAMSTANVFHPIGGSGNGLSMRSTYSSPRVLESSQGGAGTHRHSYYPDRQPTLNSFTPAVYQPTYVPSHSAGLPLSQAFMEQHLVRREQSPPHQQQNSSAESPKPPSSPAVAFATAQYQSSTVLAGTTTGQLPQQKSPFGAQPQEQMQLSASSFEPSVETQQQQQSLTPDSTTYRAPSFARNSQCQPGQSRETVAATTVSSPFSAALPPYRYTTLNDAGNTSYAAPVVSSAVSPATYYPPMLTTSCRVEAAAPFANNAPVTNWALAPEATVAQLTRKGSAEAMCANKNHRHLSDDEERVTIYSRIMDDDGRSADVRHHHREKRRCGRCC